MKIPLEFKLNDQISELIEKIEINKQIIDSVPIPLEVERNIRRKSLLKSSLFSAQIEGNLLTLDQVGEEVFRDPKEREKREISNIIKAINWLKREFDESRQMAKKDILKLHQLTMEYLMSENNLGRFRQERGAIFNQAGMVVYPASPAKEISELIDRLLNYTNGRKEKIVPIKASLAHLSFEKIHPFSDGNGRVGRLLLQAILTKDGYRMKDLIVLEEYLNEHRDEYYYFLDRAKKDATEYLQFMLKGIWQQSEEVKKAVFEKQQAKPEDSLLPRRLEILNIIRDHKLVSFDFIRRRFLRVNQRTLRYDLKKLADEKYIIKRGKTKGVFYSPKD